MSERTSGSRTIAFWKPYDVLSKFTDDQGRATLADYIELTDVWGAGRLDRDSEGLLLLSTDPKLRTLLTSPESGLTKTYLAQVEGIPSPAALNDLCSGVLVKGRQTKPAQAERVDDPLFGPRSTPVRVRKTVPDCWIRLTIREGQNRQVRRMTAAVGHPTLRLVRTAVGDVTLDGLSPGSWRDLNAQEIAALRRQR